MRSRWTQQEWGSGSKLTSVLNMTALQRKQLNSYRSSSKRQGIDARPSSRASTCLQVYVDANDLHMTLVELKHKCLPFVIPFGLGTIRVDLFVLFIYFVKSTTWLHPISQQQAWAQCVELASCRSVTHSVVTRCRTQCQLLSSYFHVCSPVTELVTTI